MGRLHRGARWDALDCRVRLGVELIVVELASISLTTLSLADLTASTLNAACVCVSFTCACRACMSDSARRRLVSSISVTSSSPTRWLPSSPAKLIPRDMDGFPGDLPA